MAENPTTEFLETTDPNAVDIVVDDERIGSLEWDPREGARLVLPATLPINEVPVSVLAEVVQRSWDPPLPKS